jgi:hypothetical protein
MTGRIFFAGLSLAVCAVPALAQTSTAPSVAASADARPTRISPRTYYAMRQRRDQLDREVATAEETYRSTEYGINQLKTIEENEERARADLKEAEAKNDVERARPIRSYLATLPALKSKLVELPKLEKELADAKAKFDAKVKEREDLEQELARIVDLEAPRQSFKLQMSVAFAALVGIVIIGFFLIAANDQEVRRQVFSGQSGLQFITLFSLVIAIILFGIVEILEGKELAALLGGLSGYILGRSTSSSTPAQQQNAANPAAAPNVPPAAMPAPATP